MCICEQFSVSPILGTDFSTKTRLLFAFEMYLFPQLDRLRLLGSVARTHILPQHLPPLVVFVVREQADVC